MGGFFPSFFTYRMNDDFFNNLYEGNLPATNVSESDKEFNIELSVPGFSKEDIKVEIEKDVLKISATSEEKKEEKDSEDKILRQEFRSSSFTRSFSLPENVDIENISALQENGILRISLPKQTKAIEDKVKKIEIR